MSARRVEAASDVEKASIDEAFLELRAYQAGSGAPLDAASARQAAELVRCLCEHYSPLGARWSFLLMAAMRDSRRLAAVKTVMSTRSHRWSRGDYDEKVCDAHRYHLACC